MNDLQDLELTRNTSNSRTKYLTMSQFKQEIILWSDDTIRRRVREDGLPALHDGKGFIFDRTAVDAWFKRRVARY